MRRHKEGVLDQEKEKSDNLEARLGLFLKSHYPTLTREGVDGGGGEGMMRINIY